MAKLITTRFFHILVIAGTAAVCLLLALWDTAIGGIQGSGYRLYSVIGRITGFGSIFVDGVEYPTAEARISVNDRPGSESELRLGQIIHITGRLHPDGSLGEASEVRYFADAYGPITQLEPGADAFVVLGQTVRLSAETVFEQSLQPSARAGLRPGTWVEVSAWPSPDGALLASRIDLVPSKATLQLTGPVTGLDAAAHTFHINALTVHYREAMLEGVLANAALVQVRGSTTSSAGTAFWATHVRVVPGASEVSDLQGPAAAAYERGQPRGPADR